jgi:hypothetical protein
LQQNPERKEKILKETVFARLTEKFGEVSREFSEIEFHDNPKLGGREVF